MFAGIRDFLQAVFYPFLIINMGCRYGSHSNDAIHRRAYIVGHIGQEIRLCPVCFFRCVKCRTQGHFLLPLFFYQIINISGSHYYSKTAVSLLYKCHPCLKIYDLIIFQFFISKGIIFSICPEMLQRQFFHKLTVR